MLLSLLMELVWIGLIVYVICRLVRKKSDRKQDEAYNGSLNGEGAARRNAPGAGSGQRPAGQARGAAGAGMAQARGAAMGTGAGQTRGAAGAGTAQTHGGHGMKAALSRMHDAEAAAGAAKSGTAGELSTMEYLEQKAREDELEHAREKQEELLQARKDMAGRKEGIRLYPGDPVPKGMRMVKCPYCGAENLVPAYERARYGCYFCREDLIL